MALCLRGAGFEAHAVPGVQGGVEWASSDEQQAQADAIYSGCMDELEERGILAATKPPTDEQLKALYEKMLDTQACLKSEGYHPGSTPSQAAFVSTGGQWTPYEVVPNGLSSSEWESLLIACPQPGTLQ